MIIILTEIHPLKLKICLEVSKDKGQFRPKKNGIDFIGFRKLMQKIFYSRADTKMKFVFDM